MNIINKILAVFHVHPIAAARIRGNVYKFIGSTLIAILAVPTNKNFVGHLIDVGIHGLSIPAWAVAAIPAGGAIVTAIVSFIGTKIGDPTTTAWIQPKAAGPVDPMAQQYAKNGTAGTPDTLTAGTIPPDMLGASPVGSPFTTDPTTTAQQPASV